MINLLPLGEDIYDDSGYFATGSGLIISVAQQVDYLAEGSGLIISVAQQVARETTGKLITVSQVVYTVSANTWLSRNGWRADVYIGGVLIPDNQVHDTITITRTENAAAQATFTLIPPRGVQNLLAYEGQPVIINVTTEDDGICRAYTGKVNIPDIDLLNRTITISCTDNRRELINSNLSYYLPSIGYYSTDVFGVSQDRASELDNRLTTTPLSVNFDVYGTLKLSSCFAKASADYVFPEASVRREGGMDPQVLLTPRSNIVNTVNINFVYRYQRMYKKYSFYEWDSDYASTPCAFMIYGYSVAKRDVIEAAIRGTGWQVEGDIGYTPVIPAGFYSCPLSGGSVASVGVSWTQTQYSTVKVTQQVATPGAPGGFTTVDVLDDQGNAVVRSVPVASVDSAPFLCFGAEFELSKRFSQNVEETFTLTVSAPQSISRFTTVSEDETVNVSSVYDSSSWDNFPGNVEPPSGRTLVRTGSNASYFFNEIENLAAYNTAVTCILNKAKTTILKSHRDNRVIFNTFLNPKLDLHHTIELDSESVEGSRIACKGKVYSITHTMNASTGDCNTKVELVLSVAEGSATDSTLPPPTRPTNSLYLLDDTLFLQSHYGEEPQLDWTGFIGNKYITVREANNTTDHRRTTFPESFVVDSPTINQSYTDNLGLAASQSYTVQLVNDDLEVEL